MQTVLGTSHRDIRDAVRSLCAEFPAEYHRKIDEQRAYPEDFVDALTRAGRMAALIPEQYGGSGLGLTEASVIMEEITRALCQQCGARREPRFCLAQRHGSAGRSSAPAADHDRHAGRSRQHSGAGAYRHGRTAKVWLCSRPGRIKPRGRCRFDIAAVGTRIEPADVRVSNSEQSGRPLARSGLVGKIRISSSSPTLTPSAFAISSWSTSIASARA